MRHAIIFCLCSLPAHAETGIASIYGNRDGAQFSKTANGEIASPRLATCAHKTAKFGTIMRITNLSNGMVAECRITDRGPFIKGRIIDVMPIVARNLGFDGLAKVKVEERK